MVYTLLAFVFLSMAMMNMVAMDYTRQLVHALRWGDLSAAQEALEKGADVDGQGYCEDANPIQLAALSGDSELLHLLDSYNVNVNNFSLNSLSALAWATYNGHLAIVEILLELGADINLPSGLVGETALHVAAKAGHLDILKLLIKSGALLDQQDILRKETPLLIAVLYRNCEIVHLLLEAGANPFIKNYNNKDAFDCIQEPRVFEFGFILRAKKPTIRCLKKYLLAKKEAAFRRVLVGVTPKLICFTDQAVDDMRRLELNADVVPIIAHYICCKPL